MARGRDENFDGSFETSRYANDSLRETFERALYNGVYVSPSDSGGVQKLTKTDSGDRVERWEPGKPGDYSHYGYNKNGKFFKK